MQTLQLLFLRDDFIKVFFVQIVKEIQDAMNGLKKPELVCKTEETCCIM